MGQATNCVDTYRDGANKQSAHPRSDPSLRRYRATHRVPALPGPAPPPATGRPALTHQVLPSARFIPGRACTFRVGEREKSVYASWPGRLRPPPTPRLCGDHPRVGGAPSRATANLGDDIIRL